MIIPLIWNTWQKEPIIWPARLNQGKSNHERGMNMKFSYNDGGRKGAGYLGQTSDCVTRSIAIATGKPYQEVYDALNTLQKSLKQTKRVRGSSSRTGVSRAIYGFYLESLGWEFVPTMGIGTGCKVHLKDGELPSGNIIARVSKHMVAVIDGVIQDTHDPSRDGTRCVYGYFQKGA